jgi:hypothetical protein
MLWKNRLIVALALTCAPALGCKSTSNTVEQNQDRGSAAVSGQGSNTNPNQPNPSGAASSVPMGEPGMAPGTADQVVPDAGITSDGAMRGGSASGLGTTMGSAGGAMGSAGAARGSGSPGAPTKGGTSPSEGGNKPAANHGGSANAGSL